MNDRANQLLRQINSSLTKLNTLIDDRQKRLLKAGSRESANALKEEIAILGAEVATLKMQQKAIKRGVIPFELVDKDETM